jgi:hypothetical protein
VEGLEERSVPSKIAMGLPINHGAHLPVVEHAPPALAGTPTPLSLSNFGFGVGGGIGSVGFGTGYGGVGGFG